MLEVVLAKPQTEKKPDGGFAYNPGLHPSHLPHPGYGGFSGNLYGSLGAGAGYGVATGYQQVLSGLQHMYLQFMCLLLDLFLVLIRLHLVGSYVRSNSQ